MKIKWLAAVTILICWFMRPLKSADRMLLLPVRLDFDLLAGWLSTQLGEPVAYGVTLDGMYFFCTHYDAICRIRLIRRKNGDERWSAEILLKSEYRGLLAWFQLMFMGTMSVYEVCSSFPRLRLSLVRKG